MRFARLDALWLLTLVPALAVVYALDTARRRRLVERLGHAPSLLAMTASVSSGRRRLRALLFTMAILALVLALCRPQAGGRARLLRKRGVDLVLALDFSKSMLAKDIRPTRLERARQELSALLDRLGGDRVGLVAFAGEPLRYPLTTDHDAARVFWRDLAPYDLPVGGTALGRALKASVDSLQRARKGSSLKGGQAIVLITDGEETEGDPSPLEMAKRAARVGIRVYTVGIGSTGGDLVPTLDENGVAAYARRPEGGFVTSRLDEGTLRQIAELTGGEYVRLDPHRFGLEELVDALATMKKAEVDARLVKQYDEAFEWFVVPALLLLLAEAWVGERRRSARRRTAAAVQSERELASGDSAAPAPDGGPPRSRVPSSPARGLGGAASPLALLLLAPLLSGFDLLHSADDDIEAGNRLMREGAYGRALAAYDRAVARLGDEPAVHFDRGAALFALGRATEAQREFLEATEARDPALKAAAFYNMGNAFLQLGRPQEAIDAFKRALALAPSDRRAKWNLEVALRRLAEQQRRRAARQQSDVAPPGAPGQPPADPRGGGSPPPAGGPAPAPPWGAGAGPSGSLPTPTPGAGGAPPSGSSPIRSLERTTAEAILNALAESERTVEQEQARRRAGNRPRPLKDW